MASLACNGTQLDQPGKWQLANHTKELADVPEVYTSNFAVPGRPGKISTLDGTPVPSVITLDFLVVGATYNGLLANLALLHGLFQTGRSSVLALDTGGGVRELVVEKLASAPVEKVNETACRLTVVLEAAGVFWRAAVATMSTVAAGNGLVLSNHTGGSAPIFDGALTVTGAGAGTNILVVDSISRAWMRLVGNIPAGTSVVIDPISLTAKAGATDYTGLLDFGPIPWRISPEAKVDVSGSGLTFTGKKAWW